MKELKNYTKIDLSKSPKSSYYGLMYVAGIEAYQGKEHTDRKFSFNGVVISEPEFPTESGIFGRIEAAFGIDLYEYQEKLKDAKTVLDLAKDLDFETEREYFDYIIESYINGQKKQVKELHHEIRDDELTSFYAYLLRSANEDVAIGVLKVLGQTKNGIETVYLSNWKDVPHIQTD